MVYMYIIDAFKIVKKYDKVFKPFSKFAEGILRKFSLLVSWRWKSLSFW